jgi:hypothetical protein
MLEPESLIQAFDERRRRAVARGWTVGTSSWIAALIAVWWLKSSASPTSSLADVLEFLAECIAFFGGAGIIATSPMCEPMVETGYSCGCDAFTSHTKPG